MNRIFRRMVRRGFRSQEDEFYLEVPSAVEVEVSYPNESIKIVDARGNKYTRPTGNIVSIEFGLNTQNVNIRDFAWGSLNKHEHFWMKFVDPIYVLYDEERIHIGY